MKKKNNKKINVYEVASKVGKTVKPIGAVALSVIGTISIQKISKLIKK